MTAPHDRPTAHEIIESVREWLERDVLSTVDGRLQFHTRVAINSLNIVLRELEIGPDQVHRHEEMLQTLRMESDEQLAQEIRNGSFDHQLIDLLHTLRPVVNDKVRVANPGYMR